MAFRADPRLAPRTVYNPYKAYEDIMTNVVGGIKAKEDAQKVMEQQILLRELGRSGQVPTIEGQPATIGQMAERPGEVSFIQDTKEMAKRHMIYDPNTGEIIYTPPTTGSLKIAPLSEEAKLETYKKKKDIDIETTIKKEKEKSKTQSELSFNKVKEMFTVLARVKADQIKETGGAGIAGGLIGNTASKLKIEGYEQTGAFAGQRRETAMAMVGLITGQNRMIEGVLKQILSTLPSEYDTASYTLAKMSQSLDNAYGIMKASQFSSDVDKKTGVRFDKYYKDNNISVMPEEVFDVVKYKILGTMADEFNKELKKPKSKTKNLSTMSDEELLEGL